LTASLSPDLQKIVVDEIDSPPEKLLVQSGVVGGASPLETVRQRLEIPTRLKIELLRRTKSKAALVYLCDLFAVKNQYQRTSIYDHDRERDAIVYDSMEAIIDLDPNVAVALLIKNLNSNGCYDSSGDRLSRLATVKVDPPILTELTKPEAIDALGSVLNRSLKSGDNIHLDELDTLGKIGTELAIAKIRDILHVDESLWFNLGWIQGLGIVREAPMVEQLLCLLYFADEYIWHTPIDSISEEDGKYYERQANELRCEAILGIERLGGDLAFDILHQSLYWIIDSNEHPNPLETIAEALFRLDRDRIFTALEIAINSKDPAVRIRVAEVLGRWYVDIEDRHLSILLAALDDLDSDVEEKIAGGIRTIINYAQRTDGRIPVAVNLTPQLLDLAVTNPKIVNFYFPNYLATMDIGDRVIQRELLVGGDSSFVKLLDVNQLDRLMSDVELTDLMKSSDYYWSDFRADAISQMGKVGDLSVLPKLISWLEDSESSIREAAIEGIVKMGTIDTIPTLLSLASKPNLVMQLIWYLETLRKKGESAYIFDFFAKNRKLLNNFLDTAERTIVDIAAEESNRTVMLVLCLGAIGSTNEAVLVLDKLIKGRYHHYHFALRSLARIDNQLAIDKLSEYLFDDSDLANHMRGELGQIFRLGIIPHLWRCEQNHYSGSLSDLIETIQEKEGLYNPDFSDRSHPLFEPFPGRLRHILLGDTSTESVDNSAIL
jgi:HEAT repeat protein